MSTRTLPFHGLRGCKNHEVKRARARVVSGWVTSWKVLVLTWDSASKASSFTDGIRADFGLRVGLAWMAVTRPKGRSVGLDKVVKCLSGGDCNTPVVYKKLRCSPCQQELFLFLV